MAKINIVEIDNEAQEAVAEIAVSICTTDGHLMPAIQNEEIRLRTFWHPVSDKLFAGKISLLGFLCSNIVLEEKFEAPIKTNAGYFSYHLHAIVQDSHMNLVRLGDVEIVLDTPIPKDIKDGSIVSFDLMRLDL